MKPFYEHDCPMCVFLGHYENQDLYYCDNEPTLIARYGSDGDYVSGMEVAVRHKKRNHDEHPLVVAFDRAVEMNLIDAEYEL